MLFKLLPKLVNIQCDLHTDHMFCHIYLVPVVPHSSVLSINLTFIAVCMSAMQILPQICSRQLLEFQDWTDKCMFCDLKMETTNNYGWNRE